MDLLLRNQVRAILVSIEEYLIEQQKINISLKLIVNEDVCIQLGGKLVDTLLAFLEATFDDKDGILEWYVFENEFGKKKLKRNVNGKKIKINSTEKFLDILFHNKHINI